VKVLQEVLDNLDELNKEVRDTSTQQPPADPRIDVWDTRKGWEQEYNLHPESSMNDNSVRLCNQVEDLLQKMQERVNQQTWNKGDKDLIDGLANILVMRLSRLTEKVLRDQANGPNM